MSEPTKRAARIAARRCGNCGGGPPKRGCVDCVRCLRNNGATKADLRAERRERGLCPECGRKRAPGRRGCPRCLRLRVLASRKYRRARRAKEGAA